ncbi:DUF4058 family protein [Brasilonema sp. UFV-L1]|nr:DUF4058 family protein [Brasilonema sp. UFV-L1]
MASPFLGMNPDLEHPELFPAFHHWLIIEKATRCQYAST